MKCGALLAALLGVCQPSFAQSFGTCDARMFMDQTNTEQTLSTLNSVNYATTPFTFTALGPASIARNGIGYNQVDNFIYGIEWVSGSGNELIRVASNGSSTNLGVITTSPGVNLPPSNYNNGVISPAGEYYIMSGYGGTTLYRINLTTRVATTITLSSTIQVSDFAWHNGILWGVNSGGTLVSVNPASGVVTSIGSTTPIGSALAMWGFNNGLFASGGGSIYAIDPATGAATLLSTINPATNNGDGANCPGATIQFDADLSVTKTNTPGSGPNDLPTDTYSQGETRTYTIVVRNDSSSFGAQNVAVSDPVPAGITASTVSWTCSATSGGSRCGAVSGTGALNDTGLDLPPNAVATYTVTMTVPTTFTGNLANTVTITPPSMINDTNTANNTATDTDLPIQQPTFGTCDARMFLGTSGNPPLSTQLNQINLSSNPVSYTTLGSPGTPAYDAMGYSPVENVIYGVGYTSFRGNELMRIGADGSVVNLGAMTLSGGGALPVQNYAGGAFSPTGEYYISSRNNSTLYRVDVTTRVATPVLTHSVFGGIIDFAFVGSDIYAPVTDVQLARINVASGTVTNIVTGGSGGGAASVWGSPNGGLFSMSGGTLWQWNLTTGSRIALGSGPATSDADGTNCPTADIRFNADLSVTKTNTPASGPNDLPDDNYVAGETRTYTMVVRNTGLYGAHGVTVSDPLPAGITSASWTCTGTGGGVCAASGSGAINDATVGLPVNATVTYLLTMTVPANHVGSLVNTVTVTPGSTTNDTNMGSNSASDVDAQATTDVSIIKTSSTGTVFSGQSTTYTIVVTNHGPVAADNAVVRDDWTTVLGLDCSAGPAACEAAGTPGTQCPSPASVTPATLQAGLAVPVLPSGGVVSFTLQCTINVP